MWHLTVRKISVSLSFLNCIKNEIIFYLISKLMLPTLNQRYDTNQFIFDPVKKQDLTVILQAVRCHILYHVSIYQTILG